MPLQQEPFEGRNQRYHQGRRRPHHISSAWKFDLYEEPDVKGSNREPVVTRVLTIMLAEEY